MTPTIISVIQQRLNISRPAIEATLKLLSEGCTIPFISRYRKEATGALDELQIEQIYLLDKELTELAKRKATILSTIKELGLLTPELMAQIQECQDATTLEDIYLPYKPKRKTKADLAKERGLEPLAKLLMNASINSLPTVCQPFIKGEIASIEEALKGARDIIAELFSIDTRVRARVRTQLQKKGIISSKIIKGKEREGEKYSDYFNWSEPLYKCSSHRYLALRRAEKEGILRVDISPESDQFLDSVIRSFHTSHSPLAIEQIELACLDGYKRLLKPSLESEVAAQTKKKADQEAVAIFADNLKQILLAPPLGRRRVLAIDPGFRTGCKVVCLNEQGDLLHSTTIYPHPPQGAYQQSIAQLTELVESYKIDTVAIGNGTASRESEALLSAISFASPVDIYSVSEQGASIYSASKVAREEFPDYDVTVRGAVSIGRRLMDPLSELVKIEPKSIGVGQYQHDVDQSLLRQSLDRTIESCVNSVGVNLNIASKYLLLYVSGLGGQLSENIVAYRSENGPFTSRKDLLKVPRMGKKAYEQSAGFLRITDAINPLDNTAVHPERYDLVGSMARKAGCSIGDLIHDPKRRDAIELKAFVSEEVGIETLQDIWQELEKPGRDPRGEIVPFSFDTTIKGLSDVKIGMQLPGIVTNITKFGCFVDVGIKENGLVHISEMADRYITDPNQIVKMHQQVTVRVIEIDMVRKRLQLSLRL